MSSVLGWRTHRRAMKSQDIVILLKLVSLKYVFPAKSGAPQRGIATGFSAPMLKGQLVSSGADIHIWPHAEGTQRGLSITPLFKSVPEAALKDERLYEFLALVDAIRLGNQRETNLAQDRFAQRMAHA